MYSRLELTLRQHLSHFRLNGDILLLGTTLSGMCVLSLQVFFHCHQCCLLLLLHHYLIVLRKKSKTEFLAWIINFSVQISVSLVGVPSSQDQVHTVRAENRGGTDQTSQDKNVQ